jgi:hypothetical protein
MENRRINAGNTGWDWMAHGWGGIGRIVLCTDWEGDEMVLGDYVGGCGFLLLDTAANLRELSAASGHLRFLWID